MPSLQPDLPPSGKASPLIGNLVFWGLLVTQFLGAFNDNYFKQMVMLKCSEAADRSVAPPPADAPGASLSADTSVAAEDDDSKNQAAAPTGNLQSWAMIAFTLPFVLLSGFGGYLSDRISKRTVVVGCKFLEIAVMGSALLVLWVQFTDPQSTLKWLIVVLGLMGAQSAIFGPAKYGILPELFSKQTLLPVNGAMQMSTFLAIIFGMALAGVALDQLEDSLWMASVAAVGIAVVGTLTSFLVSRTPVADPDLPLRIDNMFVPKQIRDLLRREPGLVMAILVMSLFWFLGGVTQQAVNDLGILTLKLNKTRTSLMAASMGVGITIGCVVAGFANKKASAGDGARWTKLGSWLLVASLSLIALLASGILGRPEVSQGKAQGLLTCLFSANAIEHSLRFSMLFLGVAAGIFVIPIQVFVQAKPPAEHKGRLIGAMNFVTWIGILLSAGWVATFNVSVGLLAPESAPQHCYLLFVSLVVLVLPVALFYRLPKLENASSN